MITKPCHRYRSYDAGSERLLTLPVLLLREDGLSWLPRWLRILLDDGLRSGLLLDGMCGLRNLRLRGLSGLLLDGLCGVHNLMLRGRSGLLLVVGRGGLLLHGMCGLRNLMLGLSSIVIQKLRASIRGKFGKLRVSPPTLER